MRSPVLITTSTGIPATTSSLALLAQFERTGVRRFAMVTLNPPDMNRTIKAHFAAAGYECVAATDSWPLSLALKSSISAIRPTV